MPLLKYEAELFVYTGAWKSILELEENITLEELFTMHRAYGNEFSKQIKTAALAAGAEIDFDDDWYDPEPPKPDMAISGSDVRFLPIGIGYDG